MLNFKNTSIVFLLLAIIGWVTNWAWYWLLLLFILYTVMLFLGSYLVNSQFYMPVICRGKTTEKKIAISFDDGPLAAYSPQILAILAEKNTPAAFFCIGHRVKNNPEILQQMHDQGHLIGNHSYSHHLWFDLFSASKMGNDITAMNEITEDLLQKSPRFFRPPYGVTNPNLAKAVKKSGLVALGWSVRSMDTIAKNEARLLDNLLRSLQPGAIFLFHDTVRITMQVLPAFIDAAREKGYEIVRLDALINERPYA
jgi:peptidoglycan-N-acetylglucosamine deacetylase